MNLNREENSESGGFEYHSVEGGNSVQVAMETAEQIYRQGLLHKIFEVEKCIAITDLDRKAFCTGIVHGMSCLFLLQSKGLVGTMITKEIKGDDSESDTRENQHGN